MTDRVTARQRWTQLDSRRSEVLNRAEEAARLTIPSLFVKQGHTENTKLLTPYQSDGARAVNSLSSKILLALFPPNQRFFKLTLDAAVREALKQAGTKIEDVEATLGKMEEMVVSRLEQTKMRSTLAVCGKHLIVTGNYCVAVDKEMTFRGFGLRSFVVNRDPAGNVLELIIREEVAPETLDDEIITACNVKNDEAKKSGEKTTNVFTRMWLDGDVYRVAQEINDVEVPGSSGSYPLHAPGFIVLRWTHVHGEDYGRGMIDEYKGDVSALEDLSRDMLKASAAAAKVLFTVDPNSHIKKNQLSTAKSGDVLTGKRDDVGTITLDKYADFRVSLERIRDIQQSLAAAFLMNSSVQRNAERVTAEEIKFMAQELEDALGGVYSVLAQELQAPLVNRVIELMTAKQQLPKLPREDINITITTGLDALGRGHDLNKIVQFVRVAKEVLGEEAVQMRLDMQWLLTQIGTSMGVDTAEAVRKEEDVQRDQQQRAMQQMVQAAAPGVAQELTKQGAQQPNG